MARAKSSRYGAGCGSVGRACLYGTEKPGAAILTEFDSQVRQEIFPPESLSVQFLTAFVQHTCAVACIHNRAHVKNPKLPNSGSYPVIVWTQENTAHTERNW